MISEWRFNAHCGCPFCLSDMHWWQMIAFSNKNASEKSIIFMNFCICYLFTYLLCRRLFFCNLRSYILYSLKKIEICTYIRSFFLRFKICRCLGSNFEFFDALQINLGNGVLWLDFRQQRKKSLRMWFIKERFYIIVFRRGWQYTIGCNSL